MYPERKFPSPSEALEWRQLFEQRHALLQKLNKQVADREHPEDNSIEELKNIKARMKQFDSDWSPPAKVPVPRSFLSRVGIYDIRSACKKDLVPVQINELIQDADSLSKITSGTARACISICKPQSCFLQHRQTKRRRWGPACTSASERQHFAQA